MHFGGTLADRRPFRAQANRDRLLRKWEREVGTPRPQPDKMQGTDRLDRARVEADHAVKGIAQLEEFFAVLGDNPNGDPNRCGFGFRSVEHLSGLMTQIADPLKVRNAGAMTCPPDGVTRKTASPR